MSFTAADVQKKITELTAAESPFVLKDLEVGGQTLKGFANAPADLVQLLQAGRGHGDKVFMVYEGRRLTFDDFFRQADALGAQLQGRYGLERGDRVAIAMRNCPEWAVAFVGTVLAGGIAVPLNSWGKTDELMYGINDCGAKVLVCDPQRYALIEGALGESDPQIIVAGGQAVEDVLGVSDFDTVVAEGNPEDFELARVAPGEASMILYTSGSTGYPKGTVHRHVAVAQARMNMHFVGMLNMSLEGPRELPGGAEQETPLLTVPLFHGTGLVSGLLLPLQMGQKVVLMYKWDTEKALQLIQEEKITGLTSVPAVLQELFTHPAYERYDTSSLLRIGAAGAATPEGLPELIESRVNKVSRSTGWGMTETMAVGTSMSGEIYDLNPASAGVKSPIAELRFVDSDGRVLPEGEIGEIQVRGITLCAGYWNRPDATAEIMDGEWMKTGDLGMMDAEGFLHITGRIKEIVIRGGENIYPGEIENLAYSQGAVQEVVVFGVPDEAMGEELAMVAYARADDNLTADALRDYLREKMAAYKVPKYIELVNDHLPQNASGKLFKRKIRDEFIAAMST